MKTHFVSNIILLLILNLIVKPLYIFGIELKVQNVLGESAYGMYFELWSLVFLFSIINDLGLNINNTNELSKNPKLIHERFIHIVGLKLILGLIFLLVLSIAFYLLSFNTSYYYLLILIGIIFILNSYFAFLRSNILGLGKYRTDSILSVIDRFSLVLIMGYILYFDTNLVLKIEYFLYTQIIALLIAIIAARISIWNSLPTFRFVFSYNYSKTLIKKGLPFATIVILMTIYSRMDGVMLGRLLSDNGVEAGIYVAGYRLFDAGAMFAYLFAGLLLPMYGRLLENKQKLQALSELAYKMIWVYVSILSIIFLFNHNQIAAYLYVEGDAYYGSVLLILMISLVGIAVSYIYGTMIVAKGSMKKLNWIFIICIALNFILNLYLIPSYKAYGAAIATLITQFVAMVGQIVICHQTIGLKYNFKLYVQGLIFAAVCTSIFYFSDMINMDWWTRLSLNIILSIIIAFIMKMIDFKFFLLVLKSKQQHKINQ